MSQYSPSYHALKPQHQAFVAHYIRSGCDATKACQALHPEDDEKTNKARGWKLISKPEIRNAIAEKLDQQVVKYNTGRDAIVERLFKLFEKIDALPPEQAVKAIKLELDVLKEVSAISGHHIQRTVSDQSITIELVGVDHTGAEVLPVIDVPNVPRLPDPSDPLTFSLDEIDHLSDDPPEDLPEHPSHDPENLDG